MTPKEEPTSSLSGLWDEASEWIRSEPALGWFLAQGLLVAQPVLEAFWTPADIEKLAAELETGRKESSDPAAEKSV
jgi:hypothetical protein